MSTSPEAATPRRARLGGRAAELWRYYKIGVLNTVFGYALFSALVYIGLNLYVAQIVAHVAGATFNYHTYSRHVFSTRRASIWRFAASYLVNYFLGLGLLWAIHRFIASPYLAGFLALAAVSTVNYVILKGFVFSARAARAKR